jgi:hypothetical protein
MAIWRLFGRIVEVDSTGEVAHQNTNRELPKKSIELTGSFEEIVDLRFRDDVARLTLQAEASMVLGRRWSLSQTAFNVRSQPAVTPCRLRRSFSSSMDARAIPSALAATDRPARS